MERERLIAILKEAQAEAADTIGSMNGGSNLRIGRQVDGGAK